LMLAVNYIQVGKVKGENTKWNFDKSEVTAGKYVLIGTVDGIRIVARQIIGPKKITWRAAGSWIKDERVVCWAEVDAVPEWEARA